MVTRGTSNGNQRGNAEGRRRRRLWLSQTYASDTVTHLGAPLARCYVCGCLLIASDLLGETLTLGVPCQASRPAFVLTGGDRLEPVRLLTVDRITPGCQGGTYRRTNIRPACPLHNSETGGRTRSKA